MWDNYLIYSLPIAAIVLATALYLTRNTWTQSLPRLSGSGRWIPRHLYDRLPASFQDDAAAGLSSAAFDLSGNVESGDSRQGLDDAGKREVLRIMRRYGVNFDEARRRFMQERFRREGIGADGRPRDPKFVSFS